MRQGWEKDSHKSIEVDVGMQTYVKASGTIKMQSEKKKNSFLEQEGEVIPLYEQGGTMLVRNEDRGNESNVGSVRLVTQMSESGSMKLLNPSRPPQQTEPDFMQYIKGVNLKQNDAEYLRSHFNEEDEIVNVQNSRSQAQLPPEFQGVAPELIQQNIKRLEIDMQAELETIRARYQTKIDYMQNAYTLSLEE